MISELRTASAVLGRRTALRYAGLGLIAATLAACKQNNPTQSGPAQSTPKAGPSVTALAVAAFAKGRWKVTSTVTRGGRPKAVTGELTVGDGTWSVGPGMFFEQFGAGGEYTLDGKKLRVVLRGSEEYRRKYPDIKDQTFAGDGIPASVPEASFILGWAMGSEQQTCDTQWDGRTLTIAGNDFHDNQVLVTATRL